MQQPENSEIKTIVGDRSLSEDSLLAKRQFLLEDIDVGMATRKLLQLISTNLDLPYKRLGLAGYYTIDTKMRSSKHKAAVIKYLFYDTEENQLLETFCHVKNDSKVDAMKKYIASVTRQKYIFCESAFELDGDKIEEIEEKTPLVYAQLRKLRMSTSMNKRDVSRSGKQTILNTTQLKEALIKEWFSTAMRNTRNNKEKVPLIVLWPLVYYDPEQIQYFEELRLLSATFDDFPVYLVSTRNHHPLTYEGQICREATLRDMSL